MPSQNQIYLPQPVLLNNFMSTVCICCKSSGQMFQKHCKWSANLHTSTLLRIVLSNYSKLISLSRRFLINNGNKNWQQLAILKAASLCWVEPTSFIIRLKHLPFFIDSNCLTNCCSQKHSRWNHFLTTKNNFCMG